MRKLKFRAYSKSFDTMFENYMLESATTSMVNICNEKLGKIQPNSTKIQKGIFLPTYDEDLEIMQYTGVMDENGKEVYEGDIVEYFKDYAVIKMVPGGFIIENEHFKDYMLEMAGEIKVVGNIYKNKELLEG